MFKRLSFLSSIAIVSLIALASCGTTNTVRQAVGFEGEYVDVCAPADTFEVKALCSVKVYRGTLEVFYATAVANPGEFTDDVIIKVASAEQIATPLADNALVALETYILLLEEKRSYEESGETFPPDIFVRLERLKEIAQSAYSEAAPNIQEVLTALGGG